ncbi:MAG: DUF1294 domain-containing protein [Oscillospiraceae bacterium]
MVIVYWVLGIWNLFVFGLYGVDKYRALKDKWRIKEVVLICSALIMGGVGAILGMVVFNHKTRKPWFRFLVPLSVVLNIVVLICMYCIK